MPIDKERVRNVLLDSMMMLCKNSISFRRNLKIQGLIGITVDDDEIFLVQIDERTEPTFATGGFSSTSDNTVESSSSNRTAARSATVKQEQEWIECEYTGEVPPKKRKIASMSGSSEDTRPESYKVKTEIVREDYNMYGNEEPEPEDLKMALIPSQRGIVHNEEEEEYYDDDDYSQQQSQQQMYDKVMRQQQSSSRAAADIMSAAANHHQVKPRGMMGPGVRSGLTKLFSAHTFSHHVGAGSMRSPRNMFQGSSSASRAPRMSNSMMPPSRAMPHLVNPAASRHMKSATSSLGSGGIRRRGAPNVSQSDSNSFVITESSHLCGYPECGKRFKFRHDLLRHQTRKHGREPVKRGMGNEAMGQNWGEYGDL